VTFLVELYLPHPQRGATVSRAREAPRSGIVTLRRSIYVPADEMLLLLYDARSAAATKRALTRAEIPFDRIVEAVEDCPGTFSESAPWSTQP
jgi:hypothetical protein